MVTNFTKKIFRGVMLMLMALTASVASAQSTPITICDGTDQNNYIPFYFYYLDAVNTTSQVIYPASELTEFVGKQITGLKFYNGGYPGSWNANMVVSMAEVDFATIESNNNNYIGANFQEVFNGDVACEASANTLEFTFASPFVYTGKNLVVQIQNTTAGSYMSVPFFGKELLGEFNAAYGYNGSFRYNQGFLPKVTISYGDASEHSANISAESLNFATVFTGETAVKTITIRNNGSADLTAAISGVEAPYSVSETSIEIASFSSATLDVTFAPTADGTYNQTMTIDLGEAGSFNVALSGASLTAPTGYQQAFEVGNKSLPEGWNGWSIKSTYDSGDYVYESAGASLDYFAGVEIEGVKAVSIQDNSNPVRSYPSQYEIYMISPVIEGNVMITARGTNSSSYITPELKAFKATKAENGTFTIGEEIEITWTSALTNAQWSNGIFALNEKTYVALFMNYSAVSRFDADSAEGVTGGGSGSGDNEDPAGPITICEGSDENQYVPFYFYYIDAANTTSQVIYPASELTAFVGKQISGLKFYNAGYSKAWESTMVVSMAEVDFATIAEDNGDYISGNFQEVFNGKLSGDETMNTLEFTFDTPFVYSGKNLVIEIKNTDKSSYQNVFFYGKELLGEYNATCGYNGSFRTNYGFLPKVTISYDEMREHAAKVSTESLDYSTIFTGTTVTKSVTIRNNGSADLTANISGVSAPFSVAESSLSVPSLSSVTFDVTFAPTADGSYDQTLVIDLGDAGSFNVALSGASMTAPTGYQQAFEVEDKTLPEHWNGWVVKSVYDYSDWDYIFESAEENLDYFVGTTIGGVNAISIKDNANPFKQTPNQYEIYMISPVVNGNVMITARGTNTSDYTTPEVKAYKVTTGNDGSFVIGNEISISWSPELNNAEWCKGIFSLEEKTQVALFMNYAAVSAFAADQIEIKVAEIGDEFTQNGLTYIVKTATEVGVTSVSNDVVDCTIPSSVSYCGSNFSVVSIERDAFYWSNVKSLNMPNTVTTIEYGAFRSSALETISLSENLSSIGEYAFYNTEITSIEIPDGVTAIKTSTFSQCESLTNITLPANLQSIGQGAFYKASITSIDIPASCTTIGMYAFEACSKLASATLPNGITELSMGIFQGCEALTAITIPESVVKINEGAFQDTGITAIHFPANVSALRANAFNGAPVSTITIANTNASYKTVDGVLYSADNRFLYLYPRVTESKTYDIIDGCVAVMGGAFYGCDIKNVTFPDGFVGIDSYGFCLSDLESVELPETLSELWTQAFAGTKLTSITIPESITQLNEAMFAGCENLTTVTLPATMTDIANRAFYGCTALTTINCLGATPAEFDAWETSTDPFFGVDCSKVTLNCPESALADYQASEWSDFFSIIVGVDFSSIDSIEVGGVEISIENGIITVNGENCNLTIVAMNGTVVCSEAISGEFSAKLPKGVYVITLSTPEKAISKKVML